MQISEISRFMAANTGTSTSGSASATAGKGIDSNQFLTLLMTQLTHQNPLEPLKDSEMLSQFAQLNSVEELKNIHTLMANSAAANQTGYAASLIGKSIRAALSDGTSLEGAVTSVTIEATKVYVHIGEQRALLSDVVEIKDK